MAEDNNSKLKHDEFFKRVIKSKPNMRNFLERHLHPTLKPMVDLSTAKLEKESYVDESLKKLFSDAVISIKKKKGDEEIFTYVLLEHKSSGHKWVAFHLLEYTVRLLERHRREDEKLPIVYPILVYNGTTPYKAAKNIWELFKEPEKAKAIMTGDYELLDLQAMSDEEIIKKGHWAIVEYVMKYIKEKNAITLVDEVFRNLGDAVKEDRKTDYIYLKPLLWYTSLNITKEQKTELNELVNDHLNTEEGGKLMGSLAQSYIDEGIEQGIKQGIERGELRGIEKVAKNMVAQGMDVKTISQATGLSKSDIEKLRVKILKIKE